MALSSITIDLSPYSDGLEPHTISKININGTDHEITECAYIGYLLEYPPGYHYEIIDTELIRIFPVESTDTIQLAVIFKTSEEATVVPFILEEYYENIVSGIIAKIRKMPRHMAPDEEYHKMNYQKGVSKGKYRYSKEYKGTMIKNNYFAI